MVQSNKRFVRFVRFIRFVRFVRLECWKIGILLAGRHHTISGTSLIIINMVMLISSIIKADQ
ncbi:MAG: hypothetical protein K8R35_04265 [Bacteroidales bacterium]|nr:hypothetical protein [Bacteroidales bacterium]